jgi:hypothetical protein
MRIRHAAIVVAVGLTGSAAMAADADHGAQLAKRWCSVQDRSARAPAAKAWPSMHANSFPSIQPKRRAATPFPDLPNREAAHNDSQPERGRCLIRSAQIQTDG